MTPAERQVSAWLSDAAISQDQYDQFKKMNDVMNVVDVQLHDLDLVVILADGSRLKISHKSTVLPPVEVSARKEYWTLLGITMKTYQWIILLSALGLLLALAAILLIKRHQS